MLPAPCFSLSSHPFLQLPLLLCCVFLSALHKPASCSHSSVSESATAFSSTQCYSKRNQDIIMREWSSLKVSKLSSHRQGHLLTSQTLQCVQPVVTIILPTRTFTDFSEAAVCRAKCWETPWVDEYKSATLDGTLATVQRNSCAQVQHGEPGSLLCLLTGAWVTQRHPRLCDGSSKLPSLSRSAHLAGSSTEVSLHQRFPYRTVGRDLLNFLIF